MNSFMQLGHRVHRFATGSVNREGPPPQTQVDQDDATCHLHGVGRSSDTRTDALDDGVAGEGDSQRERGYVQGNIAARRNASSGSRSLSTLRAKRWRDALPTSMIASSTNGAAASCTRVIANAPSSRVASSANSVAKPGSESRERR